MNDCRAAVVIAHNQPLEVQRVPIPDLEPGALLVRIEASTLCGTDVHRWHGPLPDGDSLPIITGHEPCGTIEAINGQRTDILGNPVKPGDRIVWSYVSCGHCYYCNVALQPCICSSRASWGHQRSDKYPYLLGSCAEYMYVPSPCKIIHVPEEVTPASAAASACAYRTVMGTPGDTAGPHPRSGAGRSPGADRSLDAMRHRCSPMAWSPARRRQSAYHYRT